MKHIVIFGKPGSGKGTMSELIVKNHEYMSMVAGDLLRTEKKSGSELGKTIASIIDKGNLVPDEMISTIIGDEVSNLSYKIVFDKETGIVFDGYPRSIQQAIDLDTFIDVDVAVYLKCDEEVLVKRLLERGKTSGREDDSDEDIIRARMKNYLEITEPVKAYYQNQGKYIEIDGNREIEEVFKDIETYL